MTEVNSRKRGEIFEVIIKTDNEDYYKAAENFCLRQMVCAKPMTNADRIRAMNDEELINIVPCPLGFSMFRCLHERQCAPCKREWLKQPAEVDECHQLKKL